MPLRSLLAILWLVGVVASFPEMALAHPGHGSGLAAGIAHPLTGLDHLLAMVAVGLWASQFDRRTMIVLPAVFVSIMAVGAALGSLGVSLPGVEAGIRMSVVVLGLAVATRFRPPLSVGAVVVALFALLHGYAHGTEIPAAASPLLYGLGFAAATVALHAAGIAIGLLAQHSVALRAAGGAIAATGLLLLVA